MHGGPYRETVIVTQHDLVAPNGTAGVPPPRLAGRLAAVRRLLLAGESAAALEAFCAGWPEHPPQPFHPAFAIRLDLPAGGPVRDYRRSLGFAAGLAAVEWADEAGAWRRECFVSRADDVVVQWLAVPPGGQLDLTVRHDVRLAGAPPGLGVAVRASAQGDEAIAWVSVEYPGGGAGYAGATRIVAAGGRCAAAGGMVRVTGGRAVLLLTRVARCAPADGMADRLGGAVTSLAADYGRLRAGHADAHRRAYGRVRLDLGASPADRARPVSELLARQDASPGTPQPALLEVLFHSGRYLLLAASGRLPPRLTGLWQGDWHAAWSGCLSINANLGVALAGAVSTDVPAAVHAVADLTAAQLPDWQVNARRIFGARGICAPAQGDGSDGLCRHFAPGYPHQMWTAGADWLLVPLLDYVEATGDEEFLRGRVLPVLTELAAFYEDFLDGRDERGHLVFAPSYSPENAPAGWTPAAVNAVMDIAAARHALTEACAAVTRLGARAPLSRWRDLLAGLPPYRVNPDGALAEWAWPPGAAGLPGGSWPARPPLGDRYDHRHVSHLYPAWPLHEINPADTPGLATAALRALELRGAENGSAHGHLHRGLAAARLRAGGLAGRQLAALAGGGFFFRSLMSSHYPGRQVYNADAACGLPGLIAEMLVDSQPARGGRPGRVCLLPAVPHYLPAGRLRGARTLTQARLDLEWDLPAGRVRAELCSLGRQPIELSCHGWPDPAGARPGAARWRCTADGPARPAGPGRWRLEAGAGSTTRILLERR